MEKRKKDNRISTQQVNPQKEEKSLHGLSSKEDVQVQLKRIEKALKRLDQLFR